MTDVTIKLNNAFRLFMSRKPFYACVYAGMKKKIDNRLPAIMGADLKNFQILINLKMIEQEEHDEDFLACVLEHEVIHLILKHPLKMIELPKEDRKLYNMAADTFINQYIPRLYKQEINGVTVLNENYCNPVTMSKAFKITVPEGLTTETYFSMFKQSRQNFEGDKYENYKIDEHGEDTEGVEDISEAEYNQKLKQALKYAKKFSNQTENLPGDIQQIIDEMLNAKIPWKTVLRQFHARSLSFLKEKSRKKRNRRYGLMFQGKKKCPNLHVAIGVDTSWSMSNEALGQIWSELHSMSQTGTKITVIEADSIVQNVYEFDVKKTPTFQGRGGTAYSPAIHKAKELDVDAMIYMGDFDSSDTPDNPFIPFLWVGVTSRGQTPPGDFGKIIYID